MTTRIRSTTLVATLLAGASLIACNSQSPASEPTPGPAVWRVSDADTTIYLYGLPNMMDADTSWRNDVFDEALNEAGTVILEADRTSPEAQAAIQQAIPQFGVYRDGRTLSGVLDEETRAQVETVTASMGVPLQALDPLKPWLAANQIGNLAMQQNGLTNTETPTVVISSAVSEAGKELAYFEEPTAFLVAVGGLPEDSQMRMFHQTLDLVQNDPEQPQRILSQWAAGDVSALAEAFHGGGEWPDETVRAVILLERNATWKTRLEEIMDTETGVYFVAVGIGHLVGEDSLIVALGGAGYEITRQ